MKILNKIINFILIGLLIVFCYFIIFVLCYVAFSLMLYTNPNGITDVFFVIIISGFLLMAAISLAVISMNYIKNLVRNKK